MVKIPPITVYYYHTQKVPVEITYLKRDGIYHIIVFTCYKEGKGIVFDSKESPRLKRIFKKLKHKSVSLRLMTLYKVIKILEKKIKEKDIPYLGLYKFKNPGSKFVKLKIR